MVKVVLMTVLLGLSLLHHQVSFALTQHELVQKAHFAIQGNHFFELKHLVEKEGLALNIPSENVYTPSLLSEAIHNGLKMMIDFLLDHNAYVDSGAVSQAVTNSNLELVKRLLKMNDIKVLLANDNIAYYGPNPLNAALLKGYEDIADYLIGQGAVYNKGSLGCAVESSNSTLVKRVIEDKNFDKSAVDFMYNPELYATPMISAISQQNLTIIQMLLSADASCCKGEEHIELSTALRTGNEDIINLLYKNGCTLKGATTSKYLAIHYAVRSGNLALVKDLVSKGEDIRAINSDGLSAIHFAAENENIDLMQYLIDQNLSVTLSSKHNYTALGQALITGNYRMAAFLISKGADVNQISYYSQYPLKLAISNYIYNLPQPLDMNQLYDMVNLLLSRGADVMKTGDYGDPYLVYGVQTGNIGVVTLLLSHGAPVNTHYKYGSTPLMEAARRGISLVKVLLDYGAEVNYANTASTTALMTAAYSGQKEVVELLLSKGANPSLRDNSQKTAYDHAVKNGYKEIADLLKSKTATTPVDNSLITKLRNKELKDAISSKNQKAAVKAIEEGADSNSLVNDKPVIIIAAENNYLDLAKAILTSGGNINAVTGNGWSALMGAAYLGHYDMVVLLVKNGADKSLETSSKHDALYYATVAKQQKVVDYLKGS